MKSTSWKALRRAAAWLLTFFLLAGELGGTGLKVVAADEDEEFFIDAEEEEAAADEEAEAEEAFVEEVEEDEADGAVPNLLKMCINGEMVDVLTNKAGTDSDKGKYFYKNGILFLVNMKISDTAGNKQNDGIICNGDLKIMVLGDCSINLRGDGMGECNGIAVNGNLSIRNANEETITTFISATNANERKLQMSLIKLLKDGGTLKIAGSTNNRGGYGIYCTGDLEIADVNSDGLGLGERVGRFPLDQNGGLAVEVVGSENSNGATNIPSVGIYAKNIEIIGSDVKAYGLMSKDLSVGVQAGEKLTVQSGSLTAASSISGSGENIRSTAVYGAHGITVETYASLDATVSGTDPNEHIAVYSGGDMVLKGSVSAKATGSTKANYAIATYKTGGKITLGTSNFIAVPEKNTIGTESSSGKDRTAVLNKDGTPASEVVIWKGQVYELWIAGTQVNDYNRNDIDGSGKIKFIPSTGTLSLNNVTGLTTDRFIKYPISANMSLKLRGKAEILVPVTGRGIKIVGGHELDLQGEFTLTGTQGMVGSELKQSNGGIRLEGAGATLTIDGEDTKLTIGGEFYDGAEAVYSASNIIIKDGTIDISGAPKALYSAGDKSGEDTARLDLQAGHISLSVTYPEQSSSRVAAIRNDEGGELILSPEMEVKKPADGADIATSDTYYRTFAGKDGKDLKELELLSPYKKLEVSQADGVYGTALAAYSPAPEAGDIVSYEGIDDTVYAASAVKPTKVGTYKVTVTRTIGTDTYRGSDTFSIEPKILTVNATGVDREYDGSVYVELKNMSLNGVVDGDDVQLETTGAYGQMDDADADEVSPKPVKKIIGTSLTGDDAYNYEILGDLTGVTVNISKAVWNYTEEKKEVSAGEAIVNEELEHYFAPDSTIGAVTVVQGASQLAEGPALSGTKLSLKLKESLSSDNVILEIPVTNATNYKDYKLKITLIVPHTCDKVKVEKVSANCTTAGCMEHFKCSICGKLYLNEQDTEPVSDTELYIAPLGHDWNNGVITVFPTKVKDGKKVYRCRRCGEEKVVIVPAGSTHSALDPVPEDLDTAETLYLVQGQKFNMPATSGNWVLVNKKDNRFLSVTKKGAVKAKKVTQTPVTLSDNASGRNISVSIYKPTIDKKLKLDVGVTGTIALKDYDADHMDVYWYSPKPDVATVDQSGNVKAVSKGSVKISAYVNGKVYNCNVSVKEATISDNRTLHMNVGSSKTLSLKGIKAWQSADETIATTRNKKGVNTKKISAQSQGTVQLSASANGVEYTVDLTVEDITLKNAALKAAKGKNKYTLEMTAGDKLSLDFAYVDQELLFKSSKPAIAFANEEGVIEARSAGKSKITTKINGKTVTVTVTVKNP